MYGQQPAVGLIVVGAEKGWNKKKTENQTTRNGCEKKRKKTKRDEAHERARWPARVVATIILVLCGLSFRGGWLLPVIVFCSQDCALVPFILRSFSLPYMSVLLEQCSYHSLPWLVSVCVERGDKEWPFHGRRELPQVNTSLCPRRRLRRLPLQAGFTRLPL